jgi:hypothetical protein
MIEMSYLLETDFNEVHDRCLLAQAKGLVPPRGAVVQLEDSEGNSCDGVVHRVADNGLIYVIPEWATWRTASPTLHAVVFVEISAEPKSGGSILNSTERDLADTRGVTATFTPA